jgi:glycosyltransferase involved in cell wall biosynthesis
VVAEHKDTASWNLRQFYWGWRLFRESRRFNAVVTGWEPSAIVFAILQALLRRRRKCHVVLYTKWRVPCSRAVRWLRRREYLFASRLLDRFVTLSCRQADMHAQTWGVPREKFAVLPYHPTVDPTGIIVSDGDYVFAGGDDEKDYRTFLEAVDGLPCKVVIAALHRHHFEGLKIPGNVEILTATPKQFFDLMAGARIVVVPLLDGAVRGGEQTFLNAMLLGKPVIVLSSCGADEYIVNGESGVVLRPGDAGGLHGALTRMLEDAVLRQNFAVRAKATVCAFTPRAYCEALLRLIDECVREGAQ